MDKHNFTKGVEGMVDPIDVGTIHFMQSYSGSLPVGMQNKIIAAGASKSPYMGFVVEPYSFFLAYELKDLDWAKQLIPDNYQLVKTKIIENEDAKYYCIFGSFNVHSSAFWGTRMEFYVIAENKDTGLISWVIVDYDTNTISFDEMHGLSAGNTKSCIFTTTFDGDIIIDIQGKKNERKLILDARIDNAPEVMLDHRLWIEGNLSITYGKDLSNGNGEAFSVLFNPKELEKAKLIGKNDVQIIENTWYPGLFHDEPSELLCFPYAQHYLSDSPGHYSNIQSEEELVHSINQVDFNQLAKYSSKSMKKQLLLGNLMSFVLIFILLILLIIK